MQVGPAFLQWNRTRRLAPSFVIAAWGILLIAIFVLLLTPAFLAIGASCILYGPYSGSEPVVPDCPLALLGMMTVVGGALMTLLLAVLYLRRPDQYRLWGGAIVAACGATFLGSMLGPLLFSPIDGPIYLGVSLAVPLVPAAALGAYLGLRRPIIHLVPLLQYLPTVYVPMCVGGHPPPPLPPPRDPTSSTVPPIA